MFYGLGRRPVPLLPGWGHRQPSEKNRRQGGQPGLGAWVCWCHRQKGWSQVTNRSTHPRFSFICLSFGKPLLRLSSSLAVRKLNGVQFTQPWAVIFQFLLL